MNNLEFINHLERYDSPYGKFNSGDNTYKHAVFCNGDAIGGGESVDYNKNSCFKGFQHGFGYRFHGFLVSHGTASGCGVSDKIGICYSYTYGTHENYLFEEGQDYFNRISQCAPDELNGKFGAKDGWFGYDK